MVKIRRKKSYAQLISHARFYTKVCLLQQEKKGLYFLEVEVIWIESFLCRGSELYLFIFCIKDQVFAITRSQDFLFIRGLKYKY